MIKEFGPSWVPRVIIALISLVIVMFGAATFFHGGIDYPNSWGGVVFAPFAIVIGSLGLIVATLKPKVFAQTPKKKSRFRGWPKGRPRY
jgi:hypothetical protein